MTFQLTFNLHHTKCDGDMYETSQFYGTLCVKIFFEGGRVSETGTSIIDTTILVHSMLKPNFGSWLKLLGPPISNPKTMKEFWDLIQGLPMETCHPKFEVKLS